MSAELTAWAWQQPVKSHSQKLVLLAIADSQGVHGGVSSALIACKTGLSKKTVRASLAALNTAGITQIVDQTIAPAGFVIEINQ